MNFDQPIPTQAAAISSPNGEAAREARRMARLNQLEVLRERADIISAQLCNMIQGKLPPDACEAFAQINDPTLAFTRVCTAIRRMVALEERIDENAETRAERLAAEAAKRAQAEAAAQIADRNDKIRANRTRAHKALFRDICARDADMSHVRRELLLNDLTDDLKDLDYLGDVDTLIARLSGELDAVLAKPAAANDAARSGEAGNRLQTKMDDLNALIEQTGSALQQAMLRQAER